MQAIGKHMVIWNADDNKAGRKNYVSPGDIVKW